MPRTNIRHWMILVLYSAVAMAMSMPAVRASDVHRLWLIPLTLLVVPIALAAMTWAILRPGPWRDWVMRIFVCSAFFLLSLSFIAVWSPLSPAMPWLMKMAGLCVLMWMMTVFRLIWLLNDKVVLRRCPTCRRTALVRANPTRYHQVRSERVAFVACKSCGEVWSRSRGAIIPRCSRCGKSLWLLAPVPDCWEYYWCLVCGFRNKQRSDGRWEEASGPRDDAPYARYDFIGWLGAVLSRGRTSVEPGAGSGHAHPVERAR